MNTRDPDERDLCILTLAGAGFDALAIARQMCLSAYTVRRVLQLDADEFPNQPLGQEALP